MQSFLCCLVFFLNWAQDCWAHLEEEDNQAPQKIGSSALFALMLEHSTINHFLSHSIPVLPVAYTKIATALPGDYGQKNRVRKLACSFYPSHVTGQPCHEFFLAWNGCLFPLLRNIKPQLSYWGMWEAEGYRNKCTCRLLCQGTLLSRHADCRSKAILASQKVKHALRKNISCPGAGSRSLRLLGTLPEQGCSSAL